MTRLSALAALFVTAACASTPAPVVGYDLEREAPERTPPEHVEEVPEDVVARARGPVRALRLPDRIELSERELVEALGRADAVCVGEEHTVAEHHYAEVWLLDRLAKHVANLGLELGVGFEMFQQPFQSVLSAYQRGQIDEQELLRATEYDKRWGHPFAYYRPLLERARLHRLALVALNARRELTRAVAREGLDELDSRLRYELPELDLDNDAHRREFERRMRGHPGLTPERMENYYQAQVVWDEAMAARAARWLAAHAPVRRLVVIAGQAHCARTAVPARIERRGDFDVLGIVLTLGEPSAEVLTDFDYALQVGPKTN